MKKKAKKTDSAPKPRAAKSKGSQELKEVLALHDEIARLNKALKESEEESEALQERVQDIEIHVNLLTRLLTTLCIEKFGMRVGVLKRLIKRIEKEAIRDSQILHLESLYKMSGDGPKKKNNPSPPSSSKDDPWEDIS